MVVNVLKPALHRSSALRHGTTAAQLPVLVAFLVAAAFSEAGATSNASNETAEPTTNKTILHIGVMSVATDPGEILASVLQDLLNRPSRTILPDYVIEIDPIIHPSNDDGEAARALAAGIRPVSKGYVGIFAGWVPTLVLETLLVADAHRVLVAHISDDPILSDPVKYPYNLRGIRSMEGTARFHFYVAAANGWTKMLSVWSTPGQLEAGTRSANVHNVSMFAFVGGASSADWQYGSLLHLDLARTFQKERMRNFMLWTFDADKAYAAMCYLTTELKLGGLQLYATGSLAPGWWLAPPSLASGSCSAEEMSMAVQGYLVADHIGNAPGSSIYAFINVLPIPNDQSQDPLTCLPDFTAESFTNNPETFQAFLDAGLDYGVALGWAITMGVLFDSVCLIGLGLHEALYARGVPLEQILNREDDAFVELVESTRTRSFRSTQGFYNFYPGTGDPQELHRIAVQLAVPGRQLSDWSSDAVVEFRSGLDSAPVITMLQDRSWTWRDGSTGLSPKPDLDLYPVCAETNGILIGASCQPCSPGHYFDALLQTCRTCERGTFQTLSGRSDCDVAQPGTYVANLTNPTEAVNCSRGHRCPEAGMVNPEKCLAGLFAKETGRSSCELCSRGTFQDSGGQSECRNCTTLLEGSTTRAERSTSADDCLCPEGTLLPENGVACATCPEGMFCPLGSDMSSDPTGSFYPRLLSKYMSLTHDPLRVYKCLDDSACPGGPPGSCGAHHDRSAVACGDCEDDAYESEGQCFECGSFAIFPLIATAVGCCAAVVIMAIAVNRSMHNTPAVSLTIFALAGLVFTVLQTMNVFGEMAIEWAEPMKSILTVMSLLSFEMEYLKVGCITGGGHLRSFVVRQAIAPMSIPIILITLLFKKYSKFWPGQVRVMTELTNAVGTLFNLFFISIFLSGVNPLICYDHPGDSGSSVKFAPSIRCFDDDDHAVLVGVGVVALLLVAAPFMCLCAYGIWRYPSAILQAEHAKFVHAMRFLFIRFVPSRYYFGIVTIARSLFLCLVPVVIRGEIPLQIVALCLILFLYTIIREACCPWRGSLCNLLDGILHVLLVLLLTCAALFLEERAEANTMGAIASGLFLAMLCALGVGLLITSREKFLPRKFDYFICHHKAHAAAQARLLKIFLEASKKVSVFIDSDDLKELDTLFEIVKSQLRHLLVYLTSDTLRRPWCAGEVVTAVRKKLAITPIRCTSFKVPSDEELEHPDQYVDSEGTLHDYDIGLIDISAAFKALMAIPSLELESSLLGRRRFQSLSRAILSKGQEHPPSPGPRESSTPPSGGMMISCQPDSDEAIACGAIILVGLSAKVLSLTDKGVYFSADFGEEDASAVAAIATAARAVIIVLSTGTMTCTTQVLTMLELMREDKNRVPASMVSVSTPGFEYPSSSYFKEVLPGLHDLSTRSGFDPPTMTKLLQKFFKTIAVFLPSHGSQPSIDTAIEAIFKRSRQGFGGAGKVASQTSLGRGTPSGRLSSEKILAQESLQEQSPAEQELGNRNRIAADEEQFLPEAAEQELGKRMSEKSSTGSSATAFDRDPDTTVVDLDPGSVTEAWEVWA